MTTIPFNKPYMTGKELRSAIILPHAARSASLI
jgi:hypothetical protein